MAQIETNNADIQKCPMAPSSKIITLPVEMSKLTPVTTTAGGETAEKNDDAPLQSEQLDLNNNESNFLPSRTAMTLDLSAATTLLNFTSSTAAITPVTPESPHPSGKVFYIAAQSKTETVPFGVKYIVTLPQSNVSSSETKISVAVPPKQSDFSNTGESLSLSKDGHSPRQMMDHNTLVAISNKNEGVIASKIATTPASFNILNSPTTNSTSPLFGTKPLVSSHEPSSANDIEAFARYFKQKRMALGFTQEEVGLALGTLYGSMYSQTTICRFEALQLSFRKMCGLKRLLENWLKDATKKVGDGGIRKRKKRMSIDSAMRAVLESHFVIEKQPKREEISRIAAEMQLDKEVVRVWFCNRRQKARKLLKAAGLPDDFNKGFRPSHVSKVKQELEIPDNVLNFSLIKEES